MLFGLVLSSCSLMGLEYCRQLNLVNRDNSRLLILIYTKIWLHFAAVCASSPCTIQELSCQNHDELVKVFFQEAFA